MANNNSKARRKRWKRAQRLEAAKKWIPTCRDDNMVRRYRKWFGVTELCAVLELRMLGVDIPDARLEQARRNERDRAAHNARRKQKRARTDSFRESDETFAFIAGYTDGGAPYGITWEEMEVVIDAPTESPSTPFRGRCSRCAAGERRSRDGRRRITAVLIPAVRSARNPRRLWALPRHPFPCAPARCT